MVVTDGLFECIHTNTCRIVNTAMLFILAWLLWIYNTQQQRGRGEERREYIEDEIEDERYQHSVDEPLKRSIVVEEQLNACQIDEQTNIIEFADVNETVNVDSLNNVTFNDNDNSSSTQNSKAKLLDEDSGKNGDSGKHVVSDEQVIAEQVYVTEHISELNTANNMFQYPPAINITTDDGVFRKPKVKPNAKGISFF